MNNEPVAWILNGIIHEFDPSDWAKEQYPDQDVIPLYTHPANGWLAQLVRATEDMEMKNLHYGGPRFES